MTELQIQPDSLPEDSVSISDQYSRFLPLLMLVIGLSVTYGIWDVLKASAEQNALGHFDSRVHDTLDMTTQRLSVYQAVLRGAQGLFKASITVERDEFKAYVTMLKLADNYPGIQGVGFSLIIPPEKKAEHIKAIRAEGFLEYTVKPEGERDLYTSIIYLEPLVERNLRAFGYDMYSEPVRREAMERARDTGQAALSGKVLLVQEAQNDIQAGFLIYLPVYRNGVPQDTLAQRRENIVGWVYSPFRTADLIQGIFSTHALGLNIRLYDGEEKTEQALMYDSSPTHVVKDTITPRFSTTRQLKVAGHQWTAVISSRPSFDLMLSEQTEYTNWFAAGGVIITLLLTLIISTLQASRSRALDYAERVNHELIASEQALRESEAKLRATLDSAEVAIAWANEDSEIKYANRKFQEMFGYTLEEIPTVVDWYQRAYPDDDYRQTVVTEWEKDIITAHDQGTPIPPRELAIACKDGTVCHAILNSAWVGSNILVSFSDITERKLYEEKILLWANIFEHAEWSIVVGSADGQRIEQANPAFAQSYGYTMDEVTSIPLIDLCAPGERHNQPAQLQAVKKEGHCRFECVHMRKDGSTFPVLVDITAVKNNDGEVLYLIINVHDITDHKKAVKDLQESRTILQAILDNLPYLVWMKDEQGRFVVINKAYLENASKDRTEDVLGKTDAELWPAPLAEKYRRDDEKVIEEGKQLTMEEQVLHDSKIIWTETFKSPVLDKDGNVLGITGFARDITEKKKEEIRIRHQAHHDELTGLPNRTLFYDRMQQALALAKRDKEQLAVLFLDLNQFKPINDTFGHDVGDRMLKEVATRLQACVRESDTVARIGGDEFCILLSAVDDEQSDPKQKVSQVADKIMHTLQQPFELSGNQLSIAASIGVAIYPIDGKDGQTLTKNADIAMYLAKKDGYGSIKFFTETQT